MISIVILSVLISVLGGPTVMDTSSGVPTLTGGGTPAVSAYDTSSGVPTSP